MDITKERVEELRAKIQSKVLHSLPMLTNDDYADLLAMLGEKAEQINGPGGREETTPSALKTKFGDAGSIPAPALSLNAYDCKFINPSPGLSPEDERAEDERALTRLTEAIEYLSPHIVVNVMGGGHETLVILCKTALAHIRARLSKPVPPALEEKKP